MNELAIFAGGCFWCTEAIFKRVKGVNEVIPGYTGGKTVNPNYVNVSTGNTNHAEAIQVTFDPSIISYERLLDIFFATHDPTTLNRQGADTGTQYRSIIFYRTEKQKQSSLDKIQELKSEKKFINPITTELIPASTFYKAEDYHINYYEMNPLAPYCQIVIDPKIRKLLKKFPSEIKSAYQHN